MPDLETHLPGFRLFGMQHGVARFQKHVSARAGKQTRRGPYF
jgi:hypothetical protein